MSTNCPYCGSKKVSKTYNFNEYTCDMCESDYKLTDSGIRIFREGTWKALCLSVLHEMSNKVSGASVSDILSKVLREAAKASPNEIDIIVENLTSVAATLHSEWKANLRSVNDFTIVMEGISAFEKAAFSLKKRESELGLRIRINEDWSMGDEDGDGIDDYMTKTQDREGGGKVGGVSDWAMGQDDTTADIGEDPVTTITPPPGMPHDMEDESRNVDGTHMGDIEEADEAPAAEGGSDLDSMLDKPAEGGEGETPPAEGEAAAPAPEAGAEDTTDNKDELMANVEDAAETVEDKITRLQDKINDLKTAIDTLNGGGEPEATPAEEPAAETPEAAPAAPEAGAEAEKPAEGGEDLDSVLNSSYSRMGKHIYESILEADKRKDRKIGHRTVRKHANEGDTGGASSYKRKPDAVAAREKAIETGEPLDTDMTSEEQEENIPFTEGPAEQMENITNSTGPGSAKNNKPEIKHFIKNGKPSQAEFVKKEKDMKEAREGFNGFRVGDEVVLEGSSDTWKVSEIDNNMFTLTRKGTSTVINTFKESVRHTDARLEWQRTNELLGETAKRWKQVEENYTTTNEACVGGVCGLGGGNRLGGEKLGMGGMLLSPMTTIGQPTNIPSSVIPKNEIYKHIKDNDLHRCQREVAIPRVCEMCSNPIEEVNQVLDDAILSDSEGQTEQIDSMYEYKCAPIGEHAKKDAFSKGWQSIAESEEKPTPKKVEPIKGVGFYRTKENDIIDRLGRTAEQRLLGE